MNDAQPQPVPYEILERPGGGWYIALTADADTNDIVQAMGQIRLRVDKPVTSVDVRLNGHQLRKVKHEVFDVRVQRKMNVYQGIDDTRRNARNRRKRQRQKDRRQ